MASRDGLNTCKCNRADSFGEQFKREDFLQYSNIFAPEFNNSALHDRVLVLDVMADHGLIFPENFQHEMNETGQVGQQNNLSDREEETEDEILGDATENSSIEQRRERTDDEVLRKEYSSTTNEKPLQEHQLFIHSSWLAVQSSYFRALFYSGMKESFSKEITLKVSKEELEPHYALIEAMYKPSILADTDPYVVLQVLKLAHKYDVNLVFKRCKYILMSATMSLQLCESVLVAVSEMVATDDLTEYLETFLVNAFKPLDKVWYKDIFKNLSEVSLRMLLASSKLVVLSENTVFLALMSWCEYNDYEGPSLLSLLRPQLMTADFLHDVVFNHYLANQMDGFDKLLLSGFRYHSSSPKRRKVLANEITMRAEYEHDDEPSFTWHFRVPKNNQQMNSPEKYESEHFWWCGFEMVLSLKLESNIWSIYLYVLNIEDVSCLNFVWEIEAELLPGQRERRAKTFHDRFDLGLGCDKMEFLMSQLIQRNQTHRIDISLHLVKSLSLNLLAGN